MLKTQNYSEPMSIIVNPCHPFKNSKTILMIERFIDRIIQDCDVARKIYLFGKDVL